MRECALCVDVILYCKNSLFPENIASIKKYKLANANAGCKINGFIC